MRKNDNPIEEESDIEDRLIKRKPIQSHTFKNGEPVINESGDNMSWHGFFKRYRNAKPIPFTQIQNSGHYRNVFYQKNYDTC